MIRKLDIVMNATKEIKTDLAMAKNLLVAQAEKQEKLETNIQNIESKLNKTAEEERKSNLILYNLEEKVESRKTLYEKIVRLFSMAGVEIPELGIVNTFRIGKKENGKVRPVLIKLLAERWKHVTFEKTNKLKQLGFQISSDIVKESRIIRAKLLKARYILRNNGTEPQLRGETLKLGNHTYTMGEVEKLIQSNIPIQKEGTEGEYFTDEEEFKSDDSQADIKSVKQHFRNLRSRVNSSRNSTINKKGQQRKITNSS